MQIFNIQYFVSRNCFFYIIFLHYLFKFDTFELNQEDIQLATCPLISDHANYVPDLFDLTKDEDARNYWLDCFEKTVQTVFMVLVFGLWFNKIIFLFKKYEKQCMKSQFVEETCKKRASEFKESFLNKLKHLKTAPL
jgi:hypothetical protein